MFEDKTENKCVIAHFWCEFQSCKKRHVCSKSDTFVLYEGEGTFDQSIQTCKGIFVLLESMYVTLFLKLVYEFRKKWDDGNAASKCRQVHDVQH